MSTLPTPSADAQKHSETLKAHIQKRILEAGGWLSFADFMHISLYEPSLGYYSGGAKKFGLDGDFVTAPEISPLFAQTLARQAAQVLKISQGNDYSSDILELGAGTGKLAADLLLELETLKQLPRRYFILEVSDHLRHIQHLTLQKILSPDLMLRVQWLNTLPINFEGFILANEVLDALPVHIFHTNLGGVDERGIALAQHQFVWQNKPIHSKSPTQQQLLDVVRKLGLPDDYVSEICLAATGLTASLASVLKKGAILLIDYGFSAREYYHPQRNLGTLMCHYQHYAHTDPLINVGLQDITAHVNFTAIAQAGLDNGLTLSGFCSQAQFLMNCGVLDLLSQVSPNEMARYAPMASAVQKLLSPAEMGDLFKVIGLSKNIEVPLIGFSKGDKSYML